MSIAIMATKTQRTTQSMVAKFVKKMERGMFLSALVTCFIVLSCVSHVFLSAMDGYCASVPPPANATSGCQRSELGGDCTHTCDQGFTANTGIVCNAGDETSGFWSALPTCIGLLINPTSLLL